MIDQQKLVLALNVGDKKYGLVLPVGIGDDIADLAEQLGKITQQTILQHFGFALTLGEIDETLPD